MGKSIFAYQTVPNILLSIKLKGNLIELLAYCLKKKENPLIIDYVIFFLIMKLEVVQRNMRQYSNRTSIFIYLCWSFKNNYVYLFSVVLSLPCCA